MTDAELYEKVWAEIRKGVALARDAGVVVGSPYNLRIVRPEAPKHG